MKLYSKDIFVFRNWITLVPTVEIHIGDPQYKEKNFTISFHWLVFHARLLWIKED